MKFVAWLWEGDKKNFQLACEKHCEFNQSQDETVGKICQLVTEKKSES